MIGGYLASTWELITSIWRDRTLLRALARRDITDEYVDHGFGKGWPIINPLFLVCIYLFVFTVIFPARIPEDSPFKTDQVVYLLSGIIPWIILSQALSRSMLSIVNNASIVKQVPFPLQLLPLKSLAGPLFSGLISLVFIIGYSSYITEGATLVRHLLAFPVLCVLTFVYLLGLSLLFSTIQVFVRDFREIVNLFFAVGLFIHPILFFPSTIPEAIQPVVEGLPFTYLIYCWQDALYYGALERPIAWAVSGILALLFVIIGARIFMYSRPHFGDFL